MSISTSWSASTDDVGVTGYRLFRGGTAVGTTSSTDYIFTGLTCGTTYQLGVEAFDAAGRTSARTMLTTTPADCDPTPPVAPVAAYTFDEGQGTSATDASGHGHTGTIVGGSWTQSGRMGGALSLNGTADRVDLPALGTFYKAGFTYEAWVKKASAKSDAALMGSWVSGQNGGPMIWVDHVAGRYRLTLGKASIDDYLDSGHPPAAGQWEHIAATYDGAVARFFVDGVQVASRPFTGNMGDSNTWRIGAYGTPPGGFFDGLVDEVRIYDVPLSAAEIQAEMTNPPTPDTTPPHVSTTTPAQGATNVAMGGTVQATFDEEIDPDDGHHLHVQGRAAGRVVRPGDRRVRPRGQEGDADPLGGPQVRHDLHGDARGRDVGPANPRPRREPASRRPRRGRSRRRLRRRRSSLSTRRATRTRPTRERSSGRRACPSRASACRS